jgi:hypothetical protein
MMASKEALDELAISEGEYETIVERLGYESNDLELGLSAPTGASTTPTRTRSRY